MKRISYPLEGELPSSRRFDANSRVLFRIPNVPSRISIFIDNFEALQKIWNLLTFTDSFSLDFLDKFWQILFNVYSRTGNFSYWTKQEYILPISMLATRLCFVEYLIPLFSYGLHSTAWKSHLDIYCRNIVESLLILYKILLKSLHISHCSWIQISKEDIGKYKNVKRY